MDVLEVIHVMQRELVMIQYNRSFTLSEGADGKVELNLFSICEKRKSVSGLAFVSDVELQTKRKKSQVRSFSFTVSKPFLVKDLLPENHCQYLIHEFPAFFHHFLVDHCGLVRLESLLVRLKGVLHQADETGAPSRISGH